jgi:transglutaminase-like putative cysteine protease
VKLSTLRKAAQFVAVGLAFGSMAHSGELPLVALPLFGAAWLAALVFGPRAVQGRSRLLTMGTLGLLMVLLGAWLAGAFDFVVAASLFAAAVAANRLLERQRAADDGLVYLTALMMLAGGAALSGDIAYALYFAGFAVSATFALTLSHLERAADESRAPPSEVQRLVGRRMMVALGVLSVLALAGSVFLFFAIPRFTTGFLAPVLGHRRPVAGFSGSLRLGGYGTLKDDPRVVAHVKIEPDPLALSLGLHWRGKAFDRFDGHSWFADARLKEAPSRRLALAPRRGASSHVEVEILPEGGSPAVFLPEGAFEAGSPQRVPARRMAATLFFQRDSLGNVNLQPPPEMGYGYELRVGEAAQALVGAGGDYPEDVRRDLLALPEGLDPRVRELAQRWTRGLTDPLAKARAIEARLSSGYAYTTELPGEAADPIADFLFERKAGHCEFFASAMTLLLRASGVPARNASGYYGGRRTDEGTYVLRAGDAHAWTEVFFPGAGFVPFDATPLSARAAGASSWRERWADLMDRAQSAWLRLVIDYSFREQFEGVSGVAQAAAGLYAKLHGGGAPSAWRILLALAVLSVALGAARWLWRTAGPRLWRPLPAQREAREAVLVYRALVRRLARRGVAKGAGQTPRELVAWLRRAQRPEAGVAHEVTERTLAARFGGRALQTGEARALRQAIRRL